MNCIQAKTIPIQEYMSRKGMYPVKCNGASYWYHSPISGTYDKTPSLEVSRDGRKFHDWSSGKQGTIIELAMAIIGSTKVSSALHEIAETMGSDFSRITPLFSFHKQNESSSTYFDVDIRPLNSPALLGYARSRKIPAQIARNWLREVHYHIGNRRTDYFALGWQNNSGGYELRNKFVKQAIAPKDITVVGDLTDCLWLVFEGFFDFLSAEVLGWYQPSQMNALVLNSTSELEKAMPLFENATRIACLLDNDNAGRAATKQILDAYSYAKDYSHVYSGSNDLNEHLCSMNYSNKREILIF